MQRGGGVAFGIRHRSATSDFETRKVASAVSLRSAHVEQQSGVGEESGVEMEPPRFVTNAHSRDVRVYIRNVIETTAESKGVSIMPFVVRLSNQCYACVQHSRRNVDGSCSVSCRSDVSSNCPPDVTVVSQGEFGRG